MKKPEPGRLEQLSNNNLQVLTSEDIATLYAGDIIADSDKAIDIEMSLQRLLMKERRVDTAISLMILAGQDDKRTSGRIDYKKFSGTRFIDGMVKELQTFLALSAENQSAKRQQEKELRKPITTDSSINQ